MLSPKFSTSVPHHRELNIDKQKEEPARLPSRMNWMSRSCRLFIPKGIDRIGDRGLERLVAYGDNSDSQS